MKTMKPLLCRSLALALAVLLSAACAAEPSGQSAASSPATTTAPAPPGVVLMYVPKTLDETAAAVRLDRDDLEIRPVIEQAEEEALQAIEAYQRAALSAQRRLKAGRARARDEGGRWTSFTRRPTKKWRSTGA